jgi:hypothetical protein
MSKPHDPSGTIAAKRHSIGEPSPLTQELAAIYDSIYANDLVYVKDCWKLCGDAHCCSFQRYKSRYRVMAREPFQELPLMPGEWEWLKQKAWQQQFEPCEFRVVEHLIDGRQVRVESVVSRREGCACDHATRPTICRLYPLLPRFDLNGALIGVEATGIYEEMERIGGLQPACQLQHLPFDQMNAFLGLCAALGRSPLLRWHLEAYRLTKMHAAKRLGDRVQATSKDVFAAFEGLFLRSALVDPTALHAELTDLMHQFDKRWPGWDAPMPTACAS